MGKFDMLPDPPPTREEEELGRFLLELRHLLMSGRINAPETRRRMADVAAARLPPLPGPGRN